MFVGFSLKIDLTLWISNVFLFGKSIAGWQLRVTQHTMLNKSWLKVTFKTQLSGSTRKREKKKQKVAGWGSISSLLAVEYPRGPEALQEEENSKRWSDLCYRKAKTLTLFFLFSTLALGLWIQVCKESKGSKKGRPAAGERKRWYKSRLRLHCQKPLQQTVWTNLLTWPLEYSDWLDRATCLTNQMELL